MIKIIKQWYKGKTEIITFKNDPNSSAVVAPLVYTKYHWSAKIARAIVEFYLKHWQWIWGTTIAVASLYVAVKSLK